MGKARGLALIPAAARTTGAAALTEVEQNLSATAIDTFTKALGGREGLADVLAVADSDPEVERVVALLLDPRYEAISLRRLCTMAGLTVADLFAAFKKATIVRAHIAAMPIIATRLQGVVKDVMDRAQPYEFACTTCGGLGTLTDPKKPDAAPEPCVTCRGGGKLLALPDLDRQKLALELGQLVQKSGLTINQQANTLIADRASSSTPGALEQLQQALNEVLFARPTADAPIEDAPIEGEVVAEAPQEAAP